MQNYSFIQKELHKLLLSRKFIKKIFFEIEKSIFLEKKFDFNSYKHVFIAGLPRSGTTALLYYLYNSNNFASLTYSNMPFIMAINFFSIFQKKKNNKYLKERAHKDGIFFNVESPEAFDEIFFSTFDDTEVRTELLNFIALILKNKKKKRYLSKNNLHYKRINIIQKILPNSIFLIPYRDPLQTANSLLKQHLNFINLQEKDPFVLKYMDYVGHNEFGLHHKPWNKPTSFSNINDINYWLEQWFLFYREAFKNLKNKDKCFFVRYEQLDDENYINKLNQITGLNEKPSNFKFSLSSEKNIHKYDKKMYLYSNDLYNLINDNSILI